MISLASRSSSAAPSASHDPPLGFLARGDVGHHALPVRRLAVGATHEPRDVVEPHDASVTGDHAVLDLEGVAGSFRALVLGHHGADVIGVDRALPHAGVVHPLLGRDAEQLRHARVDVDDLQAVTRDVLGVDDGGQLLDQGPVAILGLGHPVALGVPQGDVAHDALPEQRRPVVALDQGGLVVDPHDPAVGREHAVLGHERALAVRDPLVFLARRLDIVGVELPRPRGGVRDPLFRAEPEHVEQLWAHVEQRAGLPGPLASVGAGRLDRLQVDDHGEPLHHLAEALLCVGVRDELRVTGRDVDAGSAQDALVADCHRGGGRADPAGFRGGGLDPMRHVRGGAGVGREQGRHHAGTIVGMHELGERLRVGEQRLGRATQHPLAGRAHVPEGERARVGLPHDDVEVGEQRLDAFVIHVVPCHLCNLRWEPDRAADRRGSRGHRATVGTRVAAGLEPAGHRPDHVRVPDRAIAFRHGIDPIPGRLQCGERRRRHVGLGDRLGRRALGRHAADQPAGRRDGLGRVHAQPERPQQGHRDDLGLCRAAHRAGHRLEATPALHDDRHERVRRPRAGQRDGSGDRAPG